MDSLPPGFEIDAPLASSQSINSNATDETSKSLPPGFEIDQNENKFESTGQTIGAGLEGLGRGFLGPVVPAIETGLSKLGVPGLSPQEQRIREQAHPYVSGGGEALGFGAGALTGTGEAALLSKIGEAAKVASGIGEATKLAKVGSAAAQTAAEMAVLQSGDEVSKMIMQDPDATGQQAIANIGLATALGAGGGAFVTGAISPLWKATVGPKVESFLESVTKHINGGEAALPEAVQKAAETLEITPHPIMQAALSGDPHALEMARTLYRGENPEFLAAMRELPTKSAEVVANSLGIPMEEVSHFSNRESGELLKESTISHIEKEYAPISEALNKRDTDAAKIAVSDTDRLNHASRIMEKAINTVGTDSPYYKIYEEYAQRLLAKDDISGIDKLRTELFNKSSLDRNEKQVWHDIRGMLNDFQEDQITKQYGQKGAELLNQRTETNKIYKEFAQKLDQLSHFLGIGDFRGAGTLRSKLEALTPEQIVKKFSTKGDVEGAEFLNKNFPNIAEKVRQHEAKQFLAPVVKEHLGEIVLNTKALNTKLETLMKGSPEYANFVLPKEAIEKIKAAKVMQDAISNITDMKNSGTPAGLAKVFSQLGAGAGGAVAWLMGHNPIGGTLVGHAAKILSVDAPQAVRLAMLKHMAADVPIKAEGFKAMVDMIKNVSKGESNINKAITSTFKSGSSYTIYTPKAADLEKLDKLVAKTDDDPNALTKKFGENSVLGHYMPEHQTAITNTTLKAVEYLKTLKPQPKQLNPLDKSIQPTPAEQSRYDRALSIAENPLVVIQHIKDGTLQPSDIRDLNGMYPAMYTKLSSKLMSEMVDTKHNDHSVPYKTRLGLSLFLNQPMDSTLTPALIQAAQPIPKLPPPEQPQGGGKGKGNAAKLGKSEKSYRTQAQSAEADRTGRD